MSFSFVCLGVKGRQDFVDRINVRPELDLPLQTRPAVHGVPRINEEHGAARHVVCAVQFMDGARPIDGSAGMSAPETG